MQRDLNTVNAVQVMAREMFNPNISLFIPTGGSTFQPNPNSIVQNDEARGTNHLDFFKFVGRVVGKALYDGQLIDAYFTRSFYKHMLGQPLTYQVRCAVSVKSLSLQRTHDQEFAVYLEYSDTPCFSCWRQFQAARSVFVSREEQRRDSAASCGTIDV